MQVISALILVALSAMIARANIQLRQVPESSESEQCCDDGLTDCDGWCRNTSRSLTNCGLCGHICQGANLCVDGICVGLEACEPCTETDPWDCPSYKPLDWTPNNNPNETCADMCTITECSAMVGCRWCDGVCTTFGNLNECPLTCAAITDINLCRNSTLDCQWCGTSLSGRCLGSGFSCDYVWRDCENEWTLCRENCVQTRAAMCVTDVGVITRNCNCRSAEDDAMRIEQLHLCDPDALPILAQACTGDRCLQDCAALDCTHVECCINRHCCGPHIMYFGPAPNISAVST